WSKKDQEGTTIPAWNVVQYGYMGGASQNQGISFGSRRQITQTPVISDFEKRRAVEREEREKLRKQQQEEAEELRKKQENLKVKEAEVRQQREEEKKQKEEARIAEEDDERRKRSFHVQSSAILRQEREKEFQEK